jgi:3-hydroxyacyl-[acyl-carrier-protein] dehydratase
MLKDSLYFIKENTSKNNAVEAVVILDMEHAIFKGHFPGNPVLPGACMLQMVKELLETSLHLHLQLLKADEIKFLAIIQPNAEELLFSIQYNYIEKTVLKITAKITKNNIVCFKMKGSFKQEG